MMKKLQRMISGVFLFCIRIKNKLSTFAALKISGLSIDEYIPRNTRYG
ncbi:hypothetical protein ACFFUE_01800 [Bergeyella porcorum]